jgi:hypothetical protein
MQPSLCAHSSDNWHRLTFNKHTCCETLCGSFRCVRTVRGFLCAWYAFGLFDGLSLCGAVRDLYLAWLWRPRRGRCLGWLCGCRYSAHDNTIMALLAHLGFKNFPIPRFAAHVVFELHEVDGIYFVKSLYNPDPEYYGFLSDPECSAGCVRAHVLAWPDMACRIVTAMMRTSLATRCLTNLWHISCRAVCRAPCAACRVPCAVCRVPCAVCVLGARDWWLVAGGWWLVAGAWRMVDWLVHSELVCGIWFIGEVGSFV